MYVYIHIYVYVSTWLTKRIRICHCMHQCARQHPLSASPYIKHFIAYCCTVWPPFSTTPSIEYTVQDWYFSQESDQWRIVYFRVAFCILFCRLSKALWGCGHALSSQISWSRTGCIIIDNVNVNLAYISTDTHACQHDDPGAGGAEWGAPRMINTVPYVEK